MSKLILGTASFGSNYGVKHDGQPSLKEIEKIARVAWDGGIRVIHTSWQYGLSTEARIAFTMFEWIYKDHVDQSIFYMGGKRGEHSKKGKVLYTIGERFYLPRMKIVQIPVNILDRRFLEQDYSGFIVHARSVFLQGLLLITWSVLPEWVPYMARKQIALFQMVCDLKHLQPYEAALGYVLGLDEVDHVIIGVNSAKQLEQLLAVKPLKWDYDFSIQDEMVLDPRRWPNVA